MREKNIENTKGTVLYGMHFYPGVARYSESDGSSFTILLNEDTIRSMGPTFAGRPIFVDHVDEVDSDIDTLKNEADGWVIESFYNNADGKHWAKFIVVSDRGLEAVKNGWRLSNAYVPKSFGSGGVWNGVEYQKEVTMGEYDHLAIVKNPRYEESVIMTPEEFKKYNSEKETELKKLKNSKETKKETDKMKTVLNIFKRQKVENAADFETMSVVLPKSGKELTLAKLVEDHDVILNMHGYANEDHMVKCNEKEEMSVKDLVKKYNDMLDESAKSKDEDASVSEEEKEHKASSSEGSEDQDIEYEEKKKNDDQDQDMKYEEKKKNESEKAKKEEGKKHFETVKNAPKKAIETAPKIDLSEDMLARGRSLFGK